MSLDQNWPLNLVANIHRLFRLLGREEWKLSREKVGILVQVSFKSDDDFYSIGDLSFPLVIF